MDGAAKINDPLEEYLELRKQFEEVIKLHSTDPPFLAKYMDTQLKDMPKVFDTIVTQLKIAPKDSRIILFDFVVKMSNEIKLFFHNSFNPPMPLSGKYSNVDIKLLMNGLKEQGIQLSLDAQLKSKILLTEVLRLAKPFNATVDDYMITISFDALNDTEIAFKAIKTLVQAIISFSMLNAFAFKLANCFDIKVDKLENGNIVLCIKVKPQFKPVVAMIHDTLRCILPLDGDDESIHFEWNMEGDAETLINSMQRAERLALRSNIHYTAHARIEHYRAILNFIKSICDANQYSDKMLTTFLFSLLNMVSGKAEINYTRDDSKLSEDNSIPTNAIFANEIKRVKEEGTFKNVLMIPILKQLHDVAKKHMENIEIAIYMPGIRVKLSGIMKKFGLLIESLS